MPRNIDRTKLCISWRTKIWLLPDPIDDRVHWVSNNAWYFDWFWTRSCPSWHMVSDGQKISVYFIYAILYDFSKCPKFFPSHIIHFYRFEKDTNNDPPVMVLQPISKILPNFLTNLIPAKQEADQRKWYESLTQMQALFRTASDCLYRVCYSILRPSLWFIKNLRESFWNILFSNFRLIEWVLRPCDSIITLWLKMKWNKVFWILKETQKIRA